MNILIYITLGAMSLGVFSQLKTNKSSRETPTPKYEVLKTLGRVEIRKYPKMVMATTNLGEGKYSNKSNKGFRRVANYIFGGNEDKKQIAMTAPVVASMGDSIKMSFIMPSNYTLEELPNPNSQDVKIVAQEEKILAVIGFGGFANDYDIKYYTSQLKNKLQEVNIDNSGQVYFYGYNPPYQLFNRTNEVAIELSNYE